MIAIKEVSHAYQGLGVVVHAGEKVPIPVRRAGRTAARLVRARGARCARVRLTDARAETGRGGCHPSLR